MTVASHRTSTRLTDRQIETALAGVDAGHRMAYHEPDEFDRETSRAVLRGEISGDEARARIVAKVAGDHHTDIL